MQKLFTALLFICVSLGSWAQSSSVIVGRILDENGLPLPGANIILTDVSNTGGVSDVNGNFSIVNISNGDHTLKTSYIGYATNEQTITTDGSILSISIRLEPGVTIGQEILVLGDRLKGQAKALNQQYSNANITNIVAADQMGRFPDANIGDAMKRIPGITMQYDQGEARFGIIRGTAPALNSVTINGERVPSAEAEIRSVQLDLIPADMIQTIEVNKALTPDMDADAIGASVNLVTRSAPSGLRISGTASSGYNFLREQPIWAGGLVIGNRFFDNKLGLIVSGSYNNQKFGSDNTEADWNYDGNNAFVENLEVRKYDVQRVRSSVSGSLDFKIAENSTIYLRSMYNHRNDWENRYRLRYKLDGAKDGGLPDDNGIVVGDFTDTDGERYRTEVRRQTKAGSPDNKDARLEDQRTQSHALSGDHLFGNVKFDWSASYSKASEERPNERYIGWRLRDEDIQTDFSNPEKPTVSVIDQNENIPANYSLQELTEEYQYTTDEDINGRFDLQIPLGTDVNTSSIKFGGRFRSKEKTRINNFFEYEPLSGFDDMSETPLKDYSDPNFAAGSQYQVGQFTTPEYFGSLDLNNPALFDKTDLLEEYAGGNFSATEKVYGGYAMLNQQIGKLFFIAGIRVEHTSVDYKGNQFNLDDESVTPTEGTGSYTNFLPGVHAKYNLSDNSVLRFAWTNTLARPNYFDLTPYRIISIDDNELAEGNPDLKPTKSMNFDLMFEHYFQSVGIVSGGFFYKDLKDYIFMYQDQQYLDPTTGNTFDEYVNPRNGANASIAGLEVAFQRQLDFLPGVLKGLGVYFNYSLSNSKANGLPIEGRENEDLPLTGNAKNTFNASLSYETKKLVIRVSLNYTSDYIDEYGDEAFFDRYYDTQTFVDVNASFAITPQLRIFADATNLTNQPLRYYQGIQERTMQSEYYKPKVNLGVKFDLFKKSAE